jgi:hypothetical protein
MDYGEDAEEEPSDREIVRLVADEFAYMINRARAHERLAEAATNDASRTIHLRLQRLYEEQAAKLRLVDFDHPWAQEY